MMSCDIQRSDYGGSGTVPIDSKPDSDGVLLSLLTGGEGDRLKCIAVY